MRSLPYLHCLNGSFSSLLLSLPPHRLSISQVLFRVVRVERRGIQRSFVPHYPHGQWIKFLADAGPQQRPKDLSCHVHVDRPAGADAA